MASTKISFDPPNKIINIIEVPTLVDGEMVVNLDVKIDIYSDGKEDWITDPYLNKFRFPLTSVGGNELPGSKELGATFFLAEGWKVRPYEADHVFRVNGNFYRSDGVSPYTSTLSNYNVMVESTVSSLVDSTVQQLADIEYAAFQGAVTIDVIKGYDGTGSVILADGSAANIGTLRAPSKNLADTMTIASTRGFNTINVVGNIIVDSGGNYSDMIFIGESHEKTVIFVSAASNIDRCEFYHAKVGGTLDADALLWSCLIEDLNYVNGEIKDCILKPPGIMTLGGSAQAILTRCITECTAFGDAYTINLGSGQELAIRDLVGKIKLINKVGIEDSSVVMSGGGIVLDMDTMTAGRLKIAGLCDVYDTLGNHIEAGTYGDFTLMNSAVSNYSIADAVWSKELSSGDLTGQIIQDIKDEAIGNMAVDPISNTLTLHRTDGSLFKTYSLTISTGEVPPYTGRVAQ